MRSTLPLAASALFALMGLKAEAAQIDDKPMTDDSTLSDDTDSSALAFRGKGGQGASNGAKGGQHSGKAQARASGQAFRGQVANQASQARSSQPTSASRVAQGASSPRTVQANRPMTAARGTGTSSQASRPGVANNSATNNSGATARSSGSNAVQAGHNPGAANQVAHNVGHGNTTHGNAVRSATSQGKPGHASAARPGRPGRPGAANARAVRVSHPRFAPARWSPGWHRAGIRGPHWHPRYWTAGVFVYSPPGPNRHVVVVDSQTGHRAEGVAAEPTRAIDRNGDVSLGVRGGSYMSDYDDGGAYGDMGLGAALRYRPAEAVGLELSWQHHSQTWSDTSSRTADPIAASVELFAFPWSRVSPYAFTGVTWTPRSVSDTYSDGWNYQHVEASDTLFGPHAGLGLELAVGKNVSVNFEGKATGYLNVAEGDATTPAAVGGTMGLNFYF